MLRYDVIELCGIFNPRVSIWGDAELWHRIHPMFDIGIVWPLR
jgi:hypothetical protein